MTDTRTSITGGVAPPEPVTITSEQLLAGGREVIIVHAESVYRLKLTGSNKLILTK